MPETAPFLGEANSRDEGLQGINSLELRVA
jgi:hypothetical protein